MNKTYLNRESVIPLYHQLADLLRDQITSGDLRKGQPLPSENDLMEQFNVSRNTVRHALDSLDSMGLIRKEQGRGTFVASSRVLSESVTLSSFTEEVERMGAEPGAVLLDIYEREAPIQVAEELRLPPSKRITCAIRLRTADDKPICLAHSWLNTIDYEDLKDADFHQLSIYEVFEEVAGSPILRATQQVWAGAATNQEAEVLNIKQGSPVLRFARTTFMTSEKSGGTPIEFVEAAFVGSRYSLETELYRSGR